MIKRLAAACLCLLMAAGCARNAGEVTEDPIPEAAAPTPTPSPTPEAVPVSLEGPVNNEGVSDLTSMGSSVTLEIEMIDFAYNPTFIKVAPASNIQLSLTHSGGLADHTFTIDSLGVDRQVEPGGEAQAVMQLPAAGVIRFYCRLHADRGMQGAFYFEDPSGTPDDTVTAADDAQSGQTTSAAPASTRGTTSTASRTGTTTGQGTGTGSSQPAGPSAGTTGAATSEATGDLGSPSGTGGTAEGQSQINTTDPFAPGFNPVPDAGAGDGQTSQQSGDGLPTRSTAPTAGTQGGGDSSPSVTQGGPGGTSSPSEPGGVSSPAGEPGPPGEATFTIR